MFLPVCLYLPLFCLVPSLLLDLHRTWPGRYTPQQLLSVHTKRVRHSRHSLFRSSAALLHLLVVAVCLMLLQP